MSERESRGAAPTELPIEPMAAPVELPAVAVIAQAAPTLQPQESHTVSPAETEEYLADRELNESFAKLVVETYGEEVVAAVCLPWTGGNGNAPAGVISPTSKEGALNIGQIGEDLRSKSVIILCCTLDYPEEENAALKVVQQLKQLDGNKCILAAHLLAPGQNHYARENYDHLMQVHQRFNRLGTNDVLLDPDWQPARLKLRIKMAVHSWKINQERLQSMLSEEPQPPPREEIQALEAAQRQLLWQDIPRELMPHFKVVNKDLEESDHTAGDYTLGATLESRFGMGNCQTQLLNGILRAGTDKKNRKVAIKINRKQDVFTPVEVEGIYREFRFLAGFVRHPNVVQALECFHGPRNVYTVMEFLPGKNLANHLSDLPGFRMNEDDVISCFSQIASAMRHCHGKDVTHRSLCLEHIVMRLTADGKHVPKLVDFRCAMIAKAGVTSVAVCGCLPCMPPEMLCEGPYQPKPADCWSIGVVLLEIAGGKGSFCQAVQLDENQVSELHTRDLASKRLLSDQIRNFFAAPGNHAVALACMGGVQNPAIQEIIENLLQPQDRRSSVNRFAADETMEDEVVQAATNEDTQAAAAA
jgi:serine/threonine protein kinase